MFHQSTFGVSIEWFEAAFPRNCRKILPEEILQDSGFKFQVFP